MRICMHAWFNLDLDDMQTINQSYTVFLQLMLEVAGGINYLKTVLIRKARASSHHALVLDSSFTVQFILRSSVNIFPWFSHWLFSRHILMVSTVPASLSVTVVESVLEAYKKTKWSRRSTTQVEQLESLVETISVSENSKIFDDFCTKLAPLNKLNKP